MKVLGINGSPRKKGNTQYALEVVTEEIRREGIQVDLIHVGNDTIKGCISCYNCMSKKTGRCVITGDKVNEYIQMMREADAIILGSPTYFGGIAGTMKSFLDMAFFVLTYGSETEDLRYKVGAGIATVRRSGETGTYQALSNYFVDGEMLVAGSNYWNIIHGAMSGDVEQDREGKQTMEILGRNIAYLLKLKDSGRDVKVPEGVEKVMTNFIR